MESTLAKVLQISVMRVYIRKYRGHTTRSELYGYRNGNKIEATELCMVPAGEEHTIGPRLVSNALASCVETTHFQIP